jgi:hypothetical protein
LRIQAFEEVLYLVEVRIAAGASIGIGVGCGRERGFGIDVVSGLLELVEPFEDDEEKGSGLGVSGDGGLDATEAAAEMGEEIPGAEGFGFGAETVHGPLVEGAAMDAAAVDVMTAVELVAEGDLAAVVSVEHDVGADTSGLGHSVGLLCDGEKKKGRTLATLGGDPFSILNSSLSSREKSKAGESNYFGLWNEWVTEFFAAGGLTGLGVATADTQMELG